MLLVKLSLSLSLPRVCRQRNDYNEDDIVLLALNRWSEKTVAIDRDTAHPNARWKFMAPDGKLAEEQNR